MLKNKKDRKRLRGGGMGSHAILITCSLLYMINLMDRQVLAAVLEPMRLDLGLTDTEVGVLQTAFLLCVSLFALPVGFLIDRWSRRKAIALIAIIWSSFTYITGLGKSFITILIPRAVVGMGEAGFSAGGTAMITAAYSREARGRVLGVFNLFVPLGAALGVVLGGYLSAHFGGWRTPFFVFAIPGVLLGIIAWFLKDYQTSGTAPDRPKKNFFTSAGMLLKIPSLRYAFIAQAMHALMAFSLLSWLPAFLMRSQEISEDRAGMLVGIISLMAIIGAPLGGIFADLWQKRNTRGMIYLPVVGDLLAMSALYPALMLNLEGPGFILALVFGILMMLEMPSMGAITQDVVSPDLKGMSMGMMNLSIYLLGGGWGPVVVGLISDSLGGGADGLKTALLITSLGGFLSSLFFWIGSRTYPADVKQASSSAVILE